MLQISQYCLPTLYDCISPLLGRETMELQSLTFLTTAEPYQILWRLSFRHLVIIVGHTHSYPHTPPYTLFTLYSRYHERNWESQVRQTITYTGVVCTHFPHNFTMFCFVLISESVLAYLDARPWHGGDSSGKKLVF